MKAQNIPVLIHFMHNKNYNFLLLEKLDRHNLIFLSNTILLASTRVHESHSKTNTWIFKFGY